MRCTKQTAGSLHDQDHFDDFFHTRQQDAVSVKTLVKILFRAAQYRHGLVVQFAGGNGAWRTKRKAVELSKSRTKKRDSGARIASTRRTLCYSHLQSHAKNDQMFRSVVSFRLCMPESGVSRIKMCGKGEEGEEDIFEVYGIFEF